MLATIFGSLAVGLVLAVLVGIVVLKMVRDKRAGKSVICGGDCSGCGGACHSVKQSAGGCSGSCAGCASAPACHGNHSVK